MDTKRTLNKHTSSLLAAGLLLAATGGCEQALFPPNLPRSQYERFTYQREGITPEQEENLLGQVRGGRPSGDIDLRSRLRPMSER